MHKIKSKNNVKLKTELLIIVVKGKPTYVVSAHTPI
jgi:hypothetical protein